MNDARGAYADYKKALELQPDFTLAAHTGATVSLASFKGRKTVVSFLPFAFTGG